MGVFSVELRVERRTEAGSRQVVDVVIARGQVTANSPVQTPCHPLRWGICVEPVLVCAGMEVGAPVCVHSCRQRQEKVEKKTDRQGDKQTDF